MVVAFNPTSLLSLSYPLGLAHAQAQRDDEFDDAAVTASTHRDVEEEAQQPCDAAVLRKVMMVGYAGSPLSPLRTLMSQHQLHRTVSDTTT